MPHRRTTQEPHGTPLTQRAARGAPRLPVARTTPCVYALCPHSVDLAVTGDGYIRLPHVESGSPQVWVFMGGFSASSNVGRQLQSETRDSVRSVGRLSKHRGQGIHVNKLLSLLPLCVCYPQHTQHLTLHVVGVAYMRILIIYLIRLILSNEQCESNKNLSPFLSK